MDNYFNVKVKCQRCLYMLWWNTVVSQYVHLQKAYINSIFPRLLLKYKVQWSRMLIDVMMDNIMG